MTKRTAHISIDPVLLGKIDKEVALMKTTRSDWLAGAAERELHRLDSSIVVPTDDTRYVTIDLYETYPGDAQAAEPKGFWANLWDFLTGRAEVTAALAFPVASYTYGLEAGDEIVVSKR